MKSALLGYCGFVGSNVRQQFPFTKEYDIHNIGEIKGESFDFVVCAAIASLKWWANQNPQDDLRRIQDLLACLDTANIHTFVLISTVDVYPIPSNVDESIDIKELENHPYGKNRAYAESFVQQRFSSFHIIRLPGLFGKNLKKNILFDLLHDNRLDRVNPKSEFQYYDLGDLWRDVSRVMQRNLKIVNFATEPVGTGEILQMFFPEKRVGEHKDDPVFYNVRTRYAHVFGSSGNYLSTKEQMLGKLEVFIQNCHP